MQVEGRTTDAPMVPSKVSSVPCGDEDLGQQENSLPTRLCLQRERTAEGP